MTIVSPVMISWIAGTHSLYSIFNAEEGCFELVVDHAEGVANIDLVDENNESHSFHISCCYDDLALTFKKKDVDFDLPLTYLNTQGEFNTFTERFAHPINLQEKPLPPPISSEELRITRLLI